VEENKARALL